MLHDASTFSGYTFKDIDDTQKFYSDVLGVEVERNEMGLVLKLSGGHNIFLYPKDDHQPATFTVLNFEVDDIDATIDGLVEKGVVFERYDNLPAQQDERGVLRGKAAGMGPDIAWFKDPNGNILSVLNG